VEKESISQGQVLIRQHNLIRDIAYTQLKNIPTAWETAERIAAKVWLTSYTPKPDSPNLEKVRGYLEAIDHYCEIKDWNEAKELFLKEIDVSSNKYRLSWQLQIWSYFWEAIQLPQKLLENCGDEVDSICWANIGSAYSCLGNYPKSIEAHEKSLAISRRMGYRKDEGTTLGNLGVAYAKLGDYNLDFYLQQLTIAREIGDLIGEGTVLGNLGITYHNRGEYAQAINLHLQHLTIARENNDSIGEASALGSLGLAFYRLKSFDFAINFSNQCLELARKIYNRENEGKALGNLGNTYQELGDYQQAIDCISQHLTIAREIKDRRSEGESLGNLGVVLTKSKRYLEALEKMQDALVIFQEIGTKDEESFALKNIAEISRRLEQQNCSSS
jgi:tetratricopeptide (TPR) repeat protein